jgi:hypothetical protein
MKPKLSIAHKIHKITGENNIDLNKLICSARKTTKYTGCTTQLEAQGKQIMHTTFLQ